MRADVDNAQYFYNFCLHFLPIVFFLRHCFRADISNVVNESALRAARKEKELVDIHDFYEANDRVIGGLEKRIVMTDSEREMIAHHEAGHCVV